MMRKVHQLCGHLSEQPSHRSEAWFGYFFVNPDTRGSLLAAEQVRSWLLFIRLSLHTDRVSARDIWKAYLKIFPLVLVKPPSPNKHCLRALYMRDYSLIRNISALNGLSEPNCDWFIGGWRRELFFVAASPFRSDEAGQAGISSHVAQRTQWSQHLHLQIITTWPVNIAARLQTAWEDWHRLLRCYSHAVVLPSGFLHPRPFSTANPFHVRPCQSVSPPYSSLHSSALRNSGCWNKNVSPPNAKRGSGSIKTWQTIMISLGQNMVHMQTSNGCVDDSIYRQLEHHQGFKVLYCLSHRIVPYMGWNETVYTESQLHPTTGRI